MDPEILKRLDALAEKFGATGERLWAAMVRHEVGRAATALAVGVIALLGIVAGIRWVRRSKDRIDELYDGNPAYVIGTVFSVIIALVALICAVLAIPDLFSPEAAALKSLLRCK